MAMMLALFLTATLALAGDAGQTPAPTPTPVPATPPAEAGPVPPPNYLYNADGRRDPFMSLVNRGAESRPGTDRGARPEGLPGLMVEEVSVRGIVQTRAGWVAMVAAPTGKTYTLRSGDRLMDGRVRTINQQAVVLLQDVNDPLSLEKQREVRKYLRGEVK
jgi:Tfp pilus assembly protein PilP